MNELAEFELNKAIDNWQKSNLSKQELTPSDIKELKEHFLITIDEIKSKGLSDEEAFAAASIRFGSKTHWSSNLRELNENSFKLKKLVLLFGGVLFFLFINYSVLCVHRLTLLVLNNFKSDFEANINAANMVINLVYVLSFLVIVNSAFGKKLLMINLIERTKLNTKRVIILLLIVIVLFAIENMTVPAIKNSLNDNHLVYDFFYKERWFEPIFLFLFAVGFIIFYFKYHKTAEV